MGDGYFMGEQYSRYVNMSLRMGVKIVGVFFLFGRYEKMQKSKNVFVIK